MRSVAFSFFYLPLLLVGIHYAESGRKTHHEIEGFFATTFDTIGEYLHRGSCRTQKPRISVFMLFDYRLIQSAAQ